MNREELRSWKLQSPLYSHLSLELINQKPEPVIILERVGGGRITLTLGEAHELQFKMLKQAIEYGRILAGTKWRWKRARKLRALGELGIPTTETVERTDTDRDLLRTEVEPNLEDPLRLKR